MSIRYGRELLGDLTIAETREWLVTNGIGGYASGTVAGSITRGYHGLLVAALRPPVDRRLMCVKVDETATYRNTAFELATNRWTSGAVSPEGFKNIQSFALEGSIPRWRYALDDALIEKRIWMEHEANTTYVAYTALAASEPLELEIRAIVDNRPFHNTGQLAWPIQVETIPGGMRVVFGGNGTLPLTLRASSGQAKSADELYRGFYLPAETARGLRDSEDHAHAATFTATIAPGATLILVASAEDDPKVDTSALDRRRERDSTLLADFRKARPAGAPQAPAWIEHLALTADQFVVARPTDSEPNGKSVIAGYHWFEDWGRDTMISLPGLALTTGRPQVAAPILRAFAQYVSEGMLPNRFPDGQSEPQYNTIDATLWYFQAIRMYHEVTEDAGLLRALYPTLEDIIAWHIKGTRYGIQVDSADGLLRGGQEGVQLTWMDAKVGDWVVTPRIGKPVEVNALWYNALVAMAGFAEVLGESPQLYRERAEAARAGFARFWNPDTGYCFDVLDGPNGADASLRPNQLFAVSLPESPLTADRQRAVVDACARALLTSPGLRSLAPSDSAYKGSYGGNQRSRDSAYHEGTVWAWLIGPFVAAHLRVYGDRTAAARLLEPLGDHIRAAGVGGISEIFEGNAPFLPRGCICQAWSVAEALRAHALTERQDKDPS